MLRIKPGVKLLGLRPEIEVALDVASSIFIQIFPDQDLWITSALDGVHSANSLHYRGLALDLRTKFLPSRLEKLKFASLMRDCLGSDYDVVLEDLLGKNEHLHVEYDPEGFDIRSLVERA